MQVSDRDHFGNVKITAKEEDLPALGYVIQAKHLQTQLTEKLDQQKNMGVFYQAQCRFLHCDNEQALVRFDSALGQTEITAKLVVGADGQNSVLRNY